MVVVVKDTRATAWPGRAAGGARGPLLTRVQDEIAAAHGPGARRCPCCGGPIRAGQRVTRIYGTSVHVRCARGRSAAEQLGC